MAVDKCIHRVKINTGKLPVFDLEGRLAEINRIRDWLDEITEWQPDKYEFKIHSMGRRIDVWFADEKDAVVCALKLS